jgi:hypothetical protein
VVVAVVAADIERFRRAGSKMLRQHLAMGLKRRTPLRSKRTRQGLRVAHV